ncbi:MAG TPA: NAD(P)-binding protein [Clostridiales bacterium]|nr:NAD(P)-binding protein [Clostridiales bacterium]HPP67951.1 NAD(P)-binding protein [Clostridiales bacterium]
MSNMVKIKVNGREVTADPSLNLLQNLLNNGIFVPNLCYRKELEAYGGCGLCLVEIKGSPKLVRACNAMPAEGMEIETDTDRIRQSRRFTLALILSDHKADCIAPCKRACPTNQDAQGYIGLISAGKDRDAMALIMRDNPLPMSIGRVCPHPCESACRRQLADEPISICHLKRYAADKNTDYIPESAEDTGKRVAVVGAGPAGLSAAYFLRLKGHKVTVFEAQEKAGGMLRYGIPAYRLPKDVLDKEIERIEKMGAEFKYGQKLGKDISLSSLKKEYDAVFLAVGAWKSSSLGCDGEDHPNVLGGIDFLYKAANGEEVKLGKRVAVVGGGNTAIDAARTARRLGAEDVTLIYRRTRAEMPAEKIEIEEAQEEGVNFKFLAVPIAVCDGESCVLLNLQQMTLGEPDATGRCAPVPIEGAVDVESFDTVIAAIGQRVLLDGLDDIELTKRGTIEVDPETYATNIEGVFAGGDAVNRGPDIAVSAIAHGKNAAAAINSYLEGELKPVRKPFYVERRDFTEKDLPEIEKEPRVKVTITEPEKRVNNFKEIAPCYTEDEAIKEASRCLECGCSYLYDCRLLPLLQEYDPAGLGIKGTMRDSKVDKSHPFIYRDNKKCILCGLCIRTCAELVGKNVYGYNGRGFETEPECAFGIGLGESQCITCGACVRACPTGAIQSRLPFEKTPALQFETKTMECPYCEKKCLLSVDYFGSRILKSNPLVPPKACNVGKYLVPLSAYENLDKLTKEQKEAIYRRIKDASAKFEGEFPADFEGLIKLIKK